MDGGNSLMAPPKAADAARIAYTPAVLADWDGDADPGEVNDALDQLAERVDDLETAGAIDAGAVTYTPADATDWNGDTDPGDVDQALDQLADRVNAVDSQTGTDNQLLRRNGLGPLYQDVPGWSATDAGKMIGRSSAFPAANAVDGTTITFDLNAANFHEVTLGGNRTLALSNATVGQVFTVALKQDGTGSRTVTWWANINWPGGVEPTLTTTGGKVDEFVFRITGTDGYGLPICRGHIGGLNFAG